MSQTSQVSVDTSDMSDREIANSRVLKATQQQVFEAFRNPELLARWWGPKGFTNTFQTFEFRDGGTWDFIMHGPDGTDYPNKSTFVEIDEPHCVVIDHIVEPLFQAVFTLEPVEDATKTRLNFLMTFEFAEVCQKLKPMCLPANEQNFDRLEAVLNHS